MSKLTIYHNPKCSKSRAALELLEASGADVDVIDYIKSPPTTKALTDLLRMLGMSASEIVRKDEDRFTDLKLDQNPPQSDLQWVQILSKNPILIQRPIVTDGKRAVMGRPPENVKKLIPKLMH
ncbi:MAG: arsenate reductase (glutaredoxin) [Bdellovibrionota bacterium]